ncbi:MAG: ATP-binding cassette domain-containing protein [Spirochaetaceae bacterium]|nr:ATP-binding cassette domain-containing protein [Spirochaetaceae bacterium]
MNKSNEVVVKLENLTHCYKSRSKDKDKTFKALDDISLEIMSGDIVGYVGLNGAGKTTTIKILSGILHNTSGEVSVNGLSPSKKRNDFTSKIGVMFGGTNQLMTSLTLEDNLELIRRIYRIEKKVFTERLEYFLALLKLTEKRKTAVRYFSFGQRIKANLMCALLHNPPLLLLDEPTIGVDIVSKDNINEFLKQVNRDFGTTIIITSHDIHNIEKIVNKVLLIDTGKLLFHGGVDAFKERYKTGNNVSIKFEDELSECILQQCENILNEFTASGVVQSENGFNFFIRSEVNPLDVVNKLNELGKIKTMNITEQTLEDIIKYAVSKEHNNES